MVGVLLAFYLSKFSKHVTSIDIPHVEFVKRLKIDFNGIKMSKFLEMDTENLNFSSNSFDYLFSWESFIIHRVKKNMKKYQQV